MIRFGKTKKGYLLVAALMLFSVITPIVRQQVAHAATLVVDSTLDTTDATPGDGNCDDGAGNCTLRAAIDEANALGGPNTINFNIPGAGVHTITPLSALHVASRITIDGTTQPGASCGTLVPASLPANSNTGHNLLITIAGGGGSLEDTLVFDAVGSDSSVVRGLNLTNATPNRRNIGMDSTLLTVECNYIGTNAAGSLAEIASTAENAINTQLSDGVVGMGDNATIQNNLVGGNNIAVNMGGSGSILRGNLIGSAVNGQNFVIPNNIGVLIANSTTGRVVEHNIISGNTTVGIEIVDSFNNTVRGNYIGLGINGTVLRNGGDGVAIHGASISNIVGALADSGRNFISGNLGSGIHIYKTSCDGDPYGTQVLNNYIGTNVLGQVVDGYGNHLSGITMNEYATTCVGSSVYRNTVGGDYMSEEDGLHSANVIAGNLEDGVRLYQGPGLDVRENPIIGNSIFGNGNLGINLAGDADDDGIADTNLGRNATNALAINNPATQANNYLNSPVITAVEAIPATAGTDENPATDAHIDVTYDLDANPADPSVPVVGYRLDFYVNDGLNNAGNGEGQHHLGWFVVDGSEVGATHSFTSSLPITGGASNITATTTALISNGCPCGFNNEATTPSLLARIGNFFMPKASAQEVNPSDLNFDLGPTSEFSLAKIFSVTTAGSVSNQPTIAAQPLAQLANTGQNIGMTTLFVDAVAALAVGVVAYMAARSRRRHYTRTG